MATIATLHRLSPNALATRILADLTANPDNPTVAIVDVRDDDHVGGHIKGSMHFPSRSLDAMLPTLVRRLEKKKVVVFHCALSQQRGPGAALRYTRERERFVEQTKERARDVAEHAAEGSRRQRHASDVAADGTDQKVYVLDRGFVGWQELYGEDERLTEAYRKELWEDGY